MPFEAWRHYFGVLAHMHPSQRPHTLFIAQNLSMDPQWKSSAHDMKMDKHIFEYTLSKFLCDKESMISVVRCVWVGAGDSCSVYRARFALNCQSYVSIRHLSTTLRPKGVSPTSSRVLLFSAILLTRHEVGGAGPAAIHLGISWPFCLPPNFF